MAVDAFAPFPPSCGAECVFVGRTRAARHDTHGALVALEYHTYAVMAQKVLERLADAVVTVYGVRAVRVVHAVGTVPVGEASVVVQVAAGHRDAAFAACRTLIDRLKADAPIWKREHWTGGITWAEGAPVGVEGGASDGVGDGAEDGAGAGSGVGEGTDEGADPPVKSA